MCKEEGEGTLLRSWIGQSTEVEEQSWQATHQVALAGGLAALVVGVVALVFATGGTQFAFVHALYLPITLGAVAFGVRGGALTAIVGGLALGPLMPADVAAGEMQASVAWIARLSFYLLGAISAGLAVRALRRRQAVAEAARAKLERTGAATLKAFAAVLETHDEATGEHCERVARNARALGAELGLDPVELDQLYWAGYLHDVGKVRIPSAILNKKGPLTDEEYAVVRQHAEFGAGLLRTITEDFELVAEGVETHHERVDGSGYPRGLKGDAIPLFGRILAVVDSFEAMTANRPYRAGMPARDALNEILFSANVLYDEDVVDAFHRLYRQGGVEVAGPATLQESESSTPQVKAPALAVPLIN